MTESRDTYCVKLILEKTTEQRITSDVTSGHGSKTIIVEKVLFLETGNEAEAVLKFLGCKDRILGQFREVK
jgi:hypothetical protein